MKHIKSRVAALLLALAMVLSLAPMAFAADEFPDMPAEEEASYAAVKSAVDNKIMTGENGMLNLEGTILRSTVSKMVVTAFAAKGEADLSGYPDVEDGKWYVEWMAKANQMGIMSGTSGKMNPSNEVTLAEVAAMLVRALGLEKGTAADLEGVEGADSVAEWAIPYLAALVKAGYISDVTGAAEPMTRGEFAEVIYKVSGGNYASEASEITEDVNGNIIITADGVSLKGMTVKGDVIIADGVDAGSIVMDGVKIEGRLVVRGAGAELKNGTTASSTVVAKPAGEVTVKADDTSRPGEITVSGTDKQVAEKVTVDMPEPNVVVAAATEVAVQNAEGGSVTLKANGASLAVESGTVANVTVADNATDVKVDVAEGATIEMVSTNEDITITGEGTVEEKEGSGTVTDAEGKEVAGSDEPVDVPAISDAPFTSEEDTSVPSGAVAHTHNYDTANPKPYDATNHVIVCKDKAAQGTEGQPGYVPAIKGCGAQVYEPHVYSIKCKPDGTVDEATASNNTAKMCACGQVAPGTITDTTVTQGTATVNETFTEADNAHTWKYTGTTDSTCSVAGAKHYVCTNTKVEDGKTLTCAGTKDEALALAPHTAVVDAEHEDAKEAKCNQDGKVFYKCSVCDAALADLTVTISQKTVAHKYGSTPTVADATCVKAGTRTWTCTECSTPKVESIDISPNAHKFGSGPATPDDGKDTHHWQCTNEDADGNRCTVKKTASHTPVAFTGTETETLKKAQAATCTVAGHTATIVCSQCSVVITESAPIAATGSHSFATAWSKDTTGHWHKCSNCSTYDAPSNAADKAAASYAEHTWDKVKKEGDSFVADTGAVCTVCGQAAGGSSGQTKGKHTCQFGEWVKQSDGSYKATCTKETTETDHEAATNGVKTHTHSYGTPPASTTGEHTKTCANCPITSEASIKESCTDAQANAEDGTEGKGVCDVCSGTMPTT